MAAIRLENIEKRYDNGIVAVRDANIEIADGEFLVLVGPSGCGKSTLLRMVAGLEEITAGNIFIGDRRVNELEPGDRDIAMVFQNYALYPHMSVRENMSFGLRMRKTPKVEIQQRVADASQILSIENLLDRKPRQLSGGQRQRVAVGRAIVRQPKAFLFDEPLSNLDAKLRVQMRTELARLHQRLQTTTVYVTHDQVEAVTLGQRIVVMKESEIQQIDSPMAIYARPANRFVAGFIGSPAMNFLEGRIESGSFVSGEINYNLGSAAAVLENQNATFGFRPEDVTTRTGHPHLARITLEVVEWMGHESIVYFQMNETPMVARLTGRTNVQAGDSMAISLPVDAWHLFQSTGDGKRIAGGG